LCVENMEETGTFDMLVSFYQTTRCHILEDSNLCSYRRENLKFERNRIDLKPAFCSIKLRSVFLRSLILT
jgi:hypothetical protein